jgi:hypothetical protein
MWSTPSSSAAADLLRPLLIPSVALSPAILKMGHKKAKGAGNVVE